jgi:hypothetical protein
VIRSGELTAWRRTCIRSAEPAQAFAEVGDEFLVPDDEDDVAGGVGVRALLAKAIQHIGPECPPPPGQGC